MYKISIISIAITALMLTGSVYAANQGGVGEVQKSAVVTTDNASKKQDNSQKTAEVTVGVDVSSLSNKKNNDEVKTQVVPTASALSEVKVQVKNQNQVQNIGEEAKVQNQVRNTGEETQVQNQENERVQNKDSVVSEQRRSNVASAVQEMLKVADRSGGLGQEIRLIAQAQNENQEKVEGSIAKLQSRSGLAKFFLGANNKEVENAKEILIQNQEQIRQLIEIKNQLQNKAEQNILEEQINVLEQNSAEIDLVLQKENKVFSLLGWLFK